MNAAPDTSTLEFRWAARGFFGLRNRIKLFRRLRRFAARGYDLVTPLEEGLSRARQSRRRKGAAMVYESLLYSIHSGERFSDALNGRIPGAERMAIAAGEESGRMDDGFEMAEFVATANRDLLGSVKKALVYPAMLVLVLIALLLVVAYLLMPQLSQMFPVPQWPIYARVLYHLGNAVRDWGLLAAGAAVVASALAVASLPRWTGGLRGWLDNWIPPWVIYRQIQGSLMLVTMSGLVRAGTPFDEALRQMIRISSPWLVAHLEVMLKAMANGDRAADAFATGLLNDDIMDDLVAYDRAGDLADAIGYLGRDGVEIVSEHVGLISRAAAGAIMVAVGGGIVWVWVSFVAVVMAMRAAHAV